MYHLLWKLYYLITMLQARKATKAALENNLFKFPHHLPLVYDVYLTVVKILLLFYLPTPLH